MRTIFSLVFIFAMGLPATLRAQSEPQSNFARLERAALAELQESNIPGLALAIVKDDRIVFAKGFGVASLETGAAVTPDTLFQIGSVTKTFTAAAIVTLAETGRLKLDAPIGSYINGLKPKLAQVTLAQLLTHSAGVKDEPAEYGLHDESALKDYLLALPDDVCLIAPGKAFSYSNVGYSLAGLALQEAMGKPYAEEMSEVLLNPLGLTRTTFRPTLAMTYAMAVGHRAQGNDKPVVVRPLADDARHWPAGFLFSNAQELARFAMVLMNEGRLDGRTVLPAAAIKKMAAPYRQAPADIFADSRYGYGLFVRPHRGLLMLEHGGSMPGFSCEMRIFPAQRLAIVVLANQEGVQFPRLYQAFDDFLPVQSQEPVQRAPRPALSMSEAEMLRYVGSYANRWTMDIFVRGGKLWLRRFGAELPITKVGNQHFTVTPPNAPQPQEFFIRPGVDGRAEFLEMFIWAFKRIG